MTEHNDETYTKHMSLKTSASTGRSLQEARPCVRCQCWTGVTRTCRKPQATYSWCHRRQRSSSGGSGSNPANKLTSGGSGGTRTRLLQGAACASHQEIAKPTSASQNEWLLLQLGFARVASTVVMQLLQQHLLGCEAESPGMYCACVNAMNKGHNVCYQNIQYITKTHSTQQKRRNLQKTIISAYSKHIWKIL